MDVGAIDRVSQSVMMLVAVSLVLGGCATSNIPQSQPQPTEQTFQFELKKALMQHGVKITGTDDNGLTKAKINDCEVTINLENIRRDYLRDGDVSVVDSFVENICNAAEDTPTNWNEAKPGIMFSAESADTDLGDCLVDKITGRLCRAIVWRSPERAHYRYLSADDLRQWHISRAVLISAAETNMSALMNQTALSFTTIDGHKLGTVECSSPFKASLIFCAAFKRVVAKKLGWPVYVTIPCRDFLYITADRDLLPRLGDVVVEENRNSGYPISTEVYEVSDRGIEVRSQFKPRSSSSSH